MEIIFRGRQTDVAARFREHATAKLNRLERLDQNAVRVDVEVCVERNPRLASQRERVELTVRSKGPAIRAEAAAEDRFCALDLALDKLDSRLRRAIDRRKARALGQGDRREPAGLAAPARPGGPAPQGGAEAPGGAVPAGGGAPPAGDLVPALPAGVVLPGPRREQAPAGGDGAAGPAGTDMVPVEMVGDGPLVVRQKFHHATPITLDQALFEMELIGHDFYLFHDADRDLPSVVYRRRGYQYGVIRLARPEAGEEHGGPPARAAGGRGTAGDRGTAGNRGTAAPASG